MTITDAGRQTYLDRVVLVNSQDEVLGTIDKVAAHRGEGVLHRAISVYLFRDTPNGPKLLVQQRSDSKIVGAGQWANTVCGNVRPGETYVQCAIRRLYEELGIECAAEKLQEVMTFTYFTHCNDQFSEREMDRVFVLQLDIATSDILPRPEEVSDIAWVSWSILTKPDGAQKMGYNWAPWFIIMLSKPDLVAGISKNIGI